ncbi:hypothetical protein CONPUDRAFT_138595 [Coniophora puteana RWD-64-598 SS2]|uniref:F-box domain-containing protein n=1 Tax=Coniophora puteana (strain RWD-64-598) TaxID=741705 RepID=A0A5M3MGC1_CONPW|nr:uncharacterized protein CONPUDRAFT_138595 [Coniophora puteana RWD-64-598 SS2]EIW78213.1 hypothetical protein CONPUDRAFT_138595 [Coniophora puteana RWD-64-598 SS2]
MPYLGTAEHTSKPGSPIPPAASAMVLPIELIIDIFGMACAPPSFFDPHLGCGSTSPWGLNLRFQKGLTLVCRAWSGAGKEFLYHDIAIRRVDQLPLLAHLLSSDSTSTLALMVKRLRVLCFVSPSQHHELDIFLKLLFSMCTKLRHFVFDPVIGGSHRSLSVGPALMALQTVPETHRDMITHVKLGFLVPLSDAVPELSRFPNLTFLSCEVSHLPPAFNGEPYELSRLEDLHLTFSFAFSQVASDNYRSVTSNLRLPALRKLSLVAERALGEHLYPFYMSFLEKHGKQLRYLVIYGDLFLVPTIEGLIRHCPCIEHLVVPHVESLTTLTHPKIVWLDAWGWHVLSPPKDPPDAYKNMPRLRGVRVLDCALFHITGPALPLVIPPYLNIGLANSDSRETSIAYPGLTICVMKGLVYQTCAQEKGGEAGEIDYGGVDSAEDDGEEGPGCPRASRT